VSRCNEKPSLTLILGSGFSSEAKLPTTKDLVKHFLKTPDHGVYNRNIEERITCILKEYWQYVFGYTSGDSPSLEDHFTVLDLAANSGHHLGTAYPPKKIRAIRRMSIHRIFQLLNSKYEHSDKIDKLFNELNNYFNVSVVTLNWDIVAENHISQGVNYGIDIELLGNDEGLIKSNGILLLKVHGSSNWVYCDCCRKIFIGTGKTAVQYKAYLEVEDFSLFNSIDDCISEKLQRERNSSKCSYCDNTLTGRVATFSYRKDLFISQFQAIWERAYNVLSHSDNWLFIGYSMPEADFEFRHLLKSAQLARKDLSKWECKVVLKNDITAVERYRKFFGISDNDVCQKGLSDWVDNKLTIFCHEKGAI
jgi:hypothetical protein